MSVKFKETLRTKGKMNAEIGIISFYKEYKDEAIKKERTTFVDFKKYSKVLKDFNKLLSNKIVYENECYKLPYRLGVLGVIKFDQNFDEDRKHKWAVDWKRSKEEGTIIYFENTDRYKWKWDKSNMKLKGKKYYQFKASRDNTRLIAKVKKNSYKIDYYRQLAK